MTPLINLWLAALVLAFLAIPATEPLAAAEFAERLAAWQGGAPAAAPVSEPAHAPIPEMIAPPSAGPTGQWQQMAFGPGHHVWASPGYGPGDGPGGCSSCGTGVCGPAGCDSCGTCGPTPCEMYCNKPIWWARGEVLLWWRQGRSLPPLVTTDPVSEDSTTAGILPDAEILFGDGRVDSNMQVGGRIDIGVWMDERQCLGIGNRFFGVGSDNLRFQIDSLDNPVLAIPFFDVDADDNESLLIAYPGLSSGSIDIEGSSSIVGNDVYARFLICRDCNSRVDFLTGWHYSRVRDELRIRANTTVTEVGGDIPLGTETDVLDQFETQNSFNGAILGIIHEYECRCWSLQSLVRVSLGNMNQRATINGQTTIAVPDEDPEVTEGGLFTNADTNIGTFRRNEFSAVSELGVTLAYHCGPCTKLTVGYSLIYWSDVLLAGEQIDPNVGGDQPSFSFNSSDYWVQGLNLGLVKEF
jgi:hypothetical protein